ncbi:hypothetical protein, partial [Thiolapillus sp.]|uniref:hypothetical protein n=1 Tax=Thiolapillus sp. TaxID=2017437 RepID=UPI0025D0559C
SSHLQIGVAVRHDGDPAFLSRVREKTMNKITTIGLDLLEPESVFSNAAFNFARSFLHLVALFGWRLPCLTAHRHDF